MTVTGRSNVFRSTKVDGGFEKETIENGVSPQKWCFFLRLSTMNPKVNLSSLLSWLIQPASDTVGETHVLRWISWIAGWSSPKAVRFHHLNLIFDKQPRNFHWFSSQRTKIHIFEASILQARHTSEASLLWSSRTPAGALSRVKVEPSLCWKAGNVNWCGISRLFWCYDSYHVRVLGI